jgi:hypothetical protein
MPIELLDYRMPHNARMITSSAQLTQKQKSFWRCAVPGGPGCGARCAAPIACSDLKRRRSRARELFNSEQERGHRRA